MVTRVHFLQRQCDSSIVSGRPYQNQNVEWKILVGIGVFLNIKRRVKKEKRIFISDGLQGPWRRG